MQSPHQKRPPFFFSSILEVLHVSFMIQNEYEMVEMQLEILSSGCFVSGFEQNKNNLNKNNFKRGISFPFLFKIWIISSYQNGKVDKTWLWFFVSGFQRFWTWDSLTSHTPHTPTTQQPTLSHIRHSLGATHDDTGLGGWYSCCSYQLCWVIFTFSPLNVTLSCACVWHSSTHSGPRNLSS